MQQIVIPYETLVTVLKSLTYKPTARLWVEDRPFLGPQLVVEQDCPPVPETPRIQQHPGKHVRLSLRVDLDSRNWTPDFIESWWQSPGAPDSVLRFIYAAVQSQERHEMREWLRVGKKFVVQPHPRLSEERGLLE